MKKITLSFFLLMITHVSFSQKLTKTVKDSIATVIKEMIKNDQKHRLQIMFGELDSTKVDSLNNLPMEIKMKWLVKVNKGEIGIDKSAKDSLRVLQKKLDVLNEVQFIQLIKTHGFPSKKVIKSKNAGVLLIHITEERHFKKYQYLFEQELKKGNLPPSEYASWYDRCLLTMGKKKLYGEYVREYPCVENIELTNIERKKIG